MKRHRGKYRSSRGNSHPTGFRGRDIGLHHNSLEQQSDESNNVEECLNAMHDDISIDNNEPYRDDSRTTSVDNNRQFRNKRPPGLRGREIGLYYRNLSQQKRANPDYEPKLLLGPDVSLPSGVLEKVEECLKKSMQENEASGFVCTQFEEEFNKMCHMDFEKFIKTSQVSESELIPSEKLNKFNEHFKLELDERKETEEYKKIRKIRHKLPAFKERKRILEAIESNQVLLIVGSTGCGKTTQVPQLLLDQLIGQGVGTEARIVCTQPRRISAVSVAERVAYERCEPLGKSVGYQIRLESKRPRVNGSILYCTTGILLQKMQTDPLSNTISTIILDEIHERSVETDLLMALLKKILPYRVDLKVILMSATVNEQVFCNYFDNCCTLNIDGTLFPVEVHYLEQILEETGFDNFGNKPGSSKNQKHGRQSQKDMKYSQMIEPHIRKIRSFYKPSVINSLRCSDSEGCTNLQFLEFLIFYICENKPPGAVLVFLPGFERIGKLSELLKNPSLPTSQRWQHKIEVYPLHSMMPTIYQKGVFEPAPEGKRKVILSTNIAETSVTIEDVVYVINTGRTKLSSYDVDSNIQTLEETWVTRANSKQRKGRAGRVQPGICYNLFTKARKSAMDETPTPEMMRCNLNSIILNMKLLHIKDVNSFLKTLIDAPNEKAISNAINLLRRIDALDEHESLTPLGVHLARLPIEPQICKMLLMSALFRCLDPIAAVAAGLSYKNPFYTPLGMEKHVDAAKKNLSNDTKSDHLLIHNVLQEYKQYMSNSSSLGQFLHNNFLNRTTLQQLERMKSQFAGLLHTARFVESNTVDDEIANLNSGNIPLLRAMLTAGLYPNISHMRKVRQIRNKARAIHSMSTPEQRNINFHPSSVNSGEFSFDSHYFVYFEKQKSTAYYIMDATMVYPMALLIFGDMVETKNIKNTFCISVAKTYYFKCNEQTATLIYKLRSQLQKLMQKKALYPSVIALNSNEENIIKAIQIILSLDEVAEYEDVYLYSDEN